ncbi:MAG TPA: hypothetical protein VGK84_03225 [Candidatus Tumulicola sp.]
MAVIVRTIRALLAASSVMVNFGFAVWGRFGLWTVIALPLPVPKVLVT